MHIYAITVLLTTPNDRQEDILRIVDASLHALLTEVEKVEILNITKYKAEN